VYIWENEDNVWSDLENSIRIMCCHITYFQDMYVCRRIMSSKWSPTLHWHYEMNQFCIKHYPFNWNVPVSKYFWHFTRFHISQGMEVANFVQLSWFSNLHQSKQLPQKYCAIYNINLKWMRIVSTLGSWLFENASLIQSFLKS